MREGSNRFEIALGDPDFGNFWTGFFFWPQSQIGDAWISDFDRVGFAENDTMCLLTGTLLPELGSRYCDTGIGPREVGVVPGDSGGPNFVDGRIVSVTSFFGRVALGDTDQILNGTWGEFSGFVPVHRNRAWIESLVPGAFGGAIPEPASWAMMLAGFALVGVAMRRQAGRASPA